MLHYVVSNLIFNEKLKSATHSIEEIEQVCMLDVLIKKVCFVSSVSVEMIKIYIFLLKTKRYFCRVLN